MAHKGEQVQGRSWKLTKEDEFFYVCGEGKKEDEV